MGGVCASRPAEAAADEAAAQPAPGTPPPISTPPSHTNLAPVPVEVTSPSPGAKTVVTPGAPVITITTADEEQDAPAQSAAATNMAALALMGAAPPLGAPSRSPPPAEKKAPPPVAASSAPPAGAQPPQPKGPFGFSLTPLTSPNRPVASHAGKRGSSAFSGAGTHAGLEVWKVSALASAVPVRGSERGTFDPAGVYMCLRTTARAHGAGPGAPPGVDRAWEAFVWVGASAHISDVGTALSLSTELWESLGEMAARSIEAQGAESARFLSLFRVVEYAPPAPAQTAAAEPAPPSRARLLRCEGERTAVLSEVPTAAASLERSQCFVLEVPPPGGTAATAAQTPSPSPTGTPSASAAAAAAAGGARNGGGGGGGGGASSAAEGPLLPSAAIFVWNGRHASARAKAGAVDAALRARAMPRYKTGALVEVLDDGITDGEGIAEAFWRALGAKSAADASGGGGMRARPSRPSRPEPPTGAWAVTRLYRLKMLHGEERGTLEPPPASGSSGGGGSKPDAERAAVTIQRVVRRRSSGRLLLEGEAVAAAPGPASSARGARVPAKTVAGASEVLSRPLTRAMLYDAPPGAAGGSDWAGAGRDLFLLSTAEGVAVWAPRGASEVARRGALERARIFVKASGRAPSTPCTAVSEGSETAHFRSHLAGFATAEVLEAAAGRLSAGAGGEKGGGGAASFVPRSLAFVERAAGATFSGGSKSPSSARRGAAGGAEAGSSALRVWRVAARTRVQLPPQEVGLLFDRDAYLVLAPQQPQQQQPAAAQHAAATQSSRQSAGSARGGGAVSGKPAAAPPQPPPRAAAAAAAAGGARHVAYLWLGGSAPVATAVAARAHLAELESELAASGSAPICVQEVRQGFEPYHFLARFGGRLVIRKGAHANDVRDAATAAEPAGGGGGGGVGGRTGSGAAPSAPAAPTTDQHGGAAESKKKGGGSNSWWPFGGGGGGGRGGGVQETAIVPPFLSPSEGAAPQAGGGAAADGVAAAPRGGGLFGGAGRKGAAREGGAAGAPPSAELASAQVAVPQTPVLLRVRGASELDAWAEEVACERGALRSDGSFIVRPGGGFGEAPPARTRAGTRVHSAHTWLWHGAHAPSLAREAALALAKGVHAAAAEETASGGRVQEVEQGREPDEIWALLGGLSTGGSAAEAGGGAAAGAPSAASLPPLSPRLFVLEQSVPGAVGAVGAAVSRAIGGATPTAEQPHLSASLGHAHVRFAELAEFSRADLQYDQCYALDTGAEVLGWVGPDARLDAPPAAPLHAGTEYAPPPSTAGTPPDGLEVAMAYAGAARARDGRPDAIAIGRVRAGAEPPFFSRHIDGSGSVRALAHAPAGGAPSRELDSVAPYEAALQRLRAATSEAAGGASPRATTTSAVAHTLQMSIQAADRLAAAGQLQEAAAMVAAAMEAAAAQEKRATDAPRRDESARIPYRVLRAGAVAGIDNGRKEAYLTDEEFAKELGMGREAFDGLPLWRQQEIKRKAGLY